MESKEVQPPATEATGDGQAGSRFQPVGVVMDPQTGRMYYTIPVGDPIRTPAESGQSPGQADPDQVDPGQVDPGQAEAQPSQQPAAPETRPAQAPPQPVYVQQVQQPQAQPLNPPDYSQLIKSVEEFAEGDASIGDVIKTLYASTAQDDQFWKGAIVGAAATVLLNSDTVRAAMGGTLGSLFGKSQKTDNPQP